MKTKTNLIVSGLLFLAWFAWAGVARAGEIHVAASLGDAEKVKALLNTNPGLVNDKDENGNTPLYWAALIGHKDIVELLLSKGADINDKDNNGRTSLFTAASAGHKDVVELLVAKGAEVNARDNSFLGQTPLHFAVQYGHKDVVELLLSKGAEVNVKDNEGRSALEFAAIRGDKDVVELLLSNGADVNARNKWEDTPLFRAANKEVAALLVARGAEVNTKDEFGQTPLYDAARDGRIEVIEWLLAHEADPNIKDHSGKTPSDIAAEYRDNDAGKKMVALLQGHGGKTAYSDAFDKGMLAVDQQEWTTAIRYFLDARKQAPYEPKILFNLGLAESKVPGRELRAICWFRAYLAASPPDVANGEAVRKQIAALEVKVEATVTKILQQSKQLIAQIPQADWSENRRASLAEVQAMLGDVEGAKKMVSSLDEDHPEVFADAFGKIAVVQARGGDFAGAEETLGQIPTSQRKDVIVTCGSSYDEIAILRALEGDIEGAVSTAAHCRYDVGALRAIAVAQMKAGRKQDAFASLAKAAEADTGSVDYDGDLYDTWWDQMALGDKEGAGKTLARMSQEGRERYRNSIDHIDDNVANAGVAYVEGKLVVNPYWGCKVSERPVELWTGMIKRELDGKRSTDLQGALQDAAAGKNPVLIFDSFLVVGRNIADNLITMRRMAQKGVRTAQEKEERQKFNF